MDDLLLSLVVDALYHVSTGNSVYLNIVTKEIVEINEDLTSEEKDNLICSIDESLDSYLKLPEQHELDGYNRMKRFIKTLGETKYIKEFEKAIKGKGAFRRFKDLLIEHNIRDYWHEFKRDEYVIIAVKLLEENRIEYINDLEDDFDTLCEKEIIKNEEHLIKFKEYMANKGLSESIMEKYSDKMDDYLNGFLLHREIISAKDGIKHVSDFFESWYPRFLIPTKDLTNSFKCSIKEFYEFFLIEKIITQEEYEDFLKDLEVCI